MKKMILHGIAGVIALAGFSSCSDFLDKKSDLKLVIPTTLDECQYMMNNSNFGYYTYTSFSELLTDDYSVLYARWALFTSPLDSKGLYIWDEEILPVTTRWNPYKTVFTANSVLSVLKEITPADDTEKVRWNDIKGCALFFRAVAFYNLAQVFAPVYDEATAATDMGIPLRLDPDINYPSVRANVQETYDRIITDLKDAIELLSPAGQNKLMPNKAAGHAMLSRVYLMMRKYDLALTSATNSLTLCNTLLDYNETTTFTRFGNPEVLFAGAGYSDGLVNYEGSINPDLIATYSADDLRKKAYFTDDGLGGYKMGGSYSGAYYYPFTGLAVDEVYLTRAECYARAEQTDEALDDLNTLAKNRYDKASFVEFDAANASEALALILGERRKELIHRGIRWSDIRRLNKEPEYAITLVRTFPDNPATYTLPPNDKRYVLLIPKEVINKSGIPQNPR